MRIFEELQARHEALLAQQAADADILDVVQQYLKDVRQQSSQVVAPTERDQLRANLRYWSGYVYERTGIYPSVDLAPADATAQVAASAGIPVGLYVAVAGVVLLGVLAFGLSPLFGDNPGTGSEGPTETPGAEVAEPTATETFVAAARTSTATPPGTGTATLTPTGTAALTPTGTGTVTPAVTATVTATPPCRPSAPPGWVVYTVQAGDTLSSLASRTDANASEIAGYNCIEGGRLEVGLSLFLPQLPLTATPDRTGVVVLLNNVEDGAEASPRATLAGSYRNLRPGWSIHVLLQPLSEAGKVYPVPSFVTVPAGGSSGEWSIDVNFGEGRALAQREQYNIRLVVAVNEATRAAIGAGVESGLDALPDEVIAFPQVTTVSRGAYYQINEIRVLYSLYFPEQEQYHLVTARPDGSDLRQLTDGANSTEFDASLSPSGEQIVFVRREPVRGVFVDSLWVMDSSGQNQRLIVSEPGAVYERPAWSPDGRYIAYSASIAGRFSQIFLYDTLTSDNTQLTSSPFNSRFPSWLPDGTALVYSSFSTAVDSPDVLTQALFRLDIASRESSLLFDNPEGQETHPAVSPDGSQVAFTFVTAGSLREIHVLDVNRMEARPVTREADDQFPRWHPDGQVIFFEAFSSSIRAVDLGDSTLSRITVEEGNSIRPEAGFVAAFLPLER